MSLLQMVAQTMASGPNAFDFSGMPVLIYGCRTFSKYAADSGAPPVCCNEGSYTGDMGGKC